MAAIQRYTRQEYAAATGLPDAVGLDYAIGVPQLTGRGPGPQLIWSYLRDVALPAEVPGEPGPEQFCVLDLARFFGERAVTDDAANR